MIPLEAAIGYLARGWSVIPTRGDKHPRVAAWKPYQERQATGAECAQWWGPAPGVGIICGCISKLAVLDVDPRHGGVDSLNALIAEGDQLPLTPTVRTGSGGVHFYFLLPPGLVVATRPGFCPGLDLKAEGSYVVAPPSPHPSGIAYKWEAGRALDSLALAPCPPWLLRDAPSPTEPGGCFQLPPSVQQGARNDTLYRLACSLRAKGCDETEILTALEVLNQRRCSPPLAAHDLLIITRSAGRYQQGHRPRRIAGIPSYGGYGLRNE